MKLYSYVIPRDFGFAPNPFYGYCTLATCKPKIRKSASVGDWVIGTGPKPKKLDGKIIFAMQISEKLSFNQYWHDGRFKWKKPFFNGSLKQTYGDNIYHYDNEQWHQEDSHHSYPDGTINYLNLNRDTSSDNVLISTLFFYFGKHPMQIPDYLITKICRNQRTPLVVTDEGCIKEFKLWITTNFEQGVNSDPRLFNTFRRYRGE